VFIPGLFYKQFYFTKPKSGHHVYIDLDLNEILKGNLQGEKPKFKLKAIEKYKNNTKNLHPQEIKPCVACETTNELLKLKNKTVDSNVYFDSPASDVKSTDVVSDAYEDNLQTDLYDDLHRRSTNNHGSASSGEALFSKILSALGENVSQRKKIMLSPLVAKIISNCGSFETNFNVNCFDKKSPILFTYNSSCSFDQSTSLEGDLQLSLSSADSRRCTLFAYVRDDVHVEVRGKMRRNYKEHLVLRSFDKGFRQNKAESFTGNFESAIMNKLGEGFIKLEYTSNVPRKNAVKPFYITIKKGSIYGKMLE